MRITLHFTWNWNWDETDDVYYYIPELPGEPIVGSVCPLPFWNGKFTSQVCIAGRYTKRRLHDSLEQAKERVAREWSGEFNDWDYSNSVWI